MTAVKTVGGRTVTLPPPLCGQPVPMPVRVKVALATPPVSRDAVGVRAGCVLPARLPATMLPVSVAWLPLPPAGDAAAAEVGGVVR